MKFMRDVYSRTHYPFFNKRDLVSVGATDKMLWQLLKEKKIKRRDGVHGTVIEYIPEKE